jgi:hypothetical protein
MSFVIGWVLDSLAIQLSIGGLGLSEDILVAVGDHPLAVVV